MISQRVKEELVDEVLTWASQQEPEDVFDKEALEQWALDNGFVKDEE